MRHYSSSKPFQLLRTWLKIKKPTALPFGQWTVWDDNLKKSRPIAFFFTETLPDWLEKPGEWLVDPIDDAIYYLRRRFFYRTHLLETGLEKGKYYDFQNRILHGAFNEMVKYVEQEKAWANIRWDDESRKKYNVPWHVSNWYLRWRPWSSPQAGMDHLIWEMNLDPEENDSQRQIAEELYILYIWWKEIRVKRDIDTDAYVESGLEEFYSQMDLKYGKNQWGVFSNRSMTPADRQEYDRLSKINHDLEEQWQREDDEMLARLVKIRRSMWT